MEAVCHRVNYCTKSKRFVFECTYEDKQYTHSELSAHWYKQYLKSGTAYKNKKKGASSDTKCNHPRRDMALEVTRGFYETLESVIPDHIQNIVALSVSKKSVALLGEAERAALLEWTIRTIYYEAYFKRHVENKSVKVLRNGNGDFKTSLYYLPNKASTPLSSSSLATSTVMKPKRKYVKRRTQTTTKKAQKRTKRKRQRRQCLDSEEDENDDSFQDSDDDDEDGDYDYYKRFKWSRDDGEYVLCNNNDGFQVNDFKTDISFINDDSMANDNCGILLFPTAVESCHQYIPQSSSSQESLESVHSSLEELELKLPTLDPSTIPTLFSPEELSLESSLERSLSEPSLLSSSSSSDPPLDNSPSHFDLSSSSFNSTLTEFDLQFPDSVNFNFL
jgi:hypothetical protein